MKTKGWLGVSKRRPLGKGYHEKNATHLLLKKKQEESTPMTGNRGETAVPSSKKKGVSVSRRESNARGDLESQKSETKMLSKRSQKKRAI